MPRVVWVLTEAPASGVAGAEVLTWDDLQLGAWPKLTTKDIILCGPVGWPSRLGVSRREEVWRALADRLRGGALVVQWVSALPEDGSETDRQCKGTLSTVRAVMGLVPGPVPSAATAACELHPDLAAQTALARLLQSSPSSRSWLRPVNELEESRWGSAVALATAAGGEALTLWLAGFAGAGFWAVLPWPLAPTEVAVPEAWSGVVRELKVLRGIMREWATEETQSGSGAASAAPRPPPKRVPPDGRYRGVGLYAVLHGGTRGALQAQVGPGPIATSHLLERGPWILATVLLGPEHPGGEVPLDDIKSAMRESKVPHGKPNTLSSYLSKLRTALREVYPDLPEDAMMMRMNRAVLDARVLASFLRTRGGSRVINPLTWVAPDDGRPRR